MKAAKEKAIELFDRFNDLEYKDYDGYPSSLTVEASKQCALIAVEREIKLTKEIMHNYHGYQDIRTPVKLFKDVINPLLEERQEVKQEIEKL